MSQCDYCGKDILFGGISEYDLRFCNKKCRENGDALVLSRSLIPEDIVNKEAQAIHQGLCPKCQGNGPVDVHTSYRVLSALVITHWRTSPNICCRSCGTKSQVCDCIFSFFLGWWSLHGLFTTPVYVFKNIVGILKGPEELNPSEKLKNLIRGIIAQQMMEEQQTET